MKKWIVVILLLFAAAGVRAQEGYRGFVGADFGVGQLNGSGHEYYMYRQWIAEVSTTHGYAFDDNWFTGGGVGMFWCNQMNEAFFPVYAAVRYCRPDIFLAPYLEARAGMIAFNSVKKDNGRAQRVYLAGSLGVEVIPDLMVNARLTYSQTPFGNMILLATVGVAYSFGN